MTGRSGYPDGVTELPQDEPVTLDPGSRYVLGNGRPYTGLIELDRVAFDAIDASTKSICAMIWVLSGSHKKASEIGEQLRELIDGEFAAQRDDLTEAESVLANE